MSDLTRSGDVSFSVLDLVPIVEGGNAAQALRNSLELAQHAERQGYRRYWVAEHHNMPGIASSATAVVIGHLAAGTNTLRVGSGGIMLPNHSPLVIAEQFGTLESLFPGRIDLGLGRAPGSDRQTAHALRRHLEQHGDDFPDLVAELFAYFHPAPSADGRESTRVRAVPGEGLDIPLWLLGSSDFSAQLAAHWGLPFAFASHFAPDFTMQALELYRTMFRPSVFLSAPHAMVGVNVVAADTDAEAAFLATSMQQQVLSLMRGRPGRLPAPVANFDELCSDEERAALAARGRFTVIGSPATVAVKLDRILRETGANEVIFSSSMYDHSARLHSYELAAQVMTEWNLSVRQK